MAKYLVPLVPHGMCLVMYHVLVMDVFHPFLLTAGETELKRRALGVWSCVRTLVLTYPVTVEGPS